MCGGGGWLSRITVIKFVMSLQPDQTVPHTSKEPQRFISHLLHYPTNTLGWITKGSEKEVALLVSAKFS